MSSFVQDFVKPLSQKPELRIQGDDTIITHLYTQSLQNILNDALEADSEAEYWDDLQRSRWNVFWYFVQTLPLRVYKGANTLTDDRTYLASLFPHIRQLHLPSDAPHLSTESLLSLLQSIRKLILTPMHYTSEEISLKKRQLLEIRDERVEALGSLILLRPELQKPADSFKQDLMQRLSRNSPSLSLHTLNLSRPSRLTRLWPRLIFGPPLLMYSAYYLYSSRGSLLDFAREAKDVAQGFIIDWCVKPLMGVLDTVKSSRAEENAGWLVTKEGVKADYDSLERMALALASDHLHYTPDQLNQLSARIRLGDLTPVLKLYEEDIKSPVRSALGGTLLRTVFIQVQKAKVDLDQALSGIDRLMKSQELTFAFVGLSPALAIVYVLGGYVRRMISPTESGKYGGHKERKRIFWVMRRVERVLALDQSRNDQGQPSALTTGLLILSLTQLRAYAERHLPESSSSSSSSSTAPSSESSLPSLRSAFLEDISDLQDPELTGSQKQAIVDRMWRSWGGVLGWSPV